jgi:predicted PurR-regulated permease PerM
MTDRNPAGSHLRASIAVWALALLGTMVFLRYASALMIPIVLGLLISLALNPLVAWLERHHVHRVVGSTLVLLTVAAALGAGVYSLRDQAREVLAGVPRAVRQMRESVQSGGRDGLVADLRRAVAEVQAAASGEGTGSEPASGTPVGSARAGAGATSGTSLVVQGSNSLLTLTGNVVVIFFLVFFVLIGGPGFHRRIVNAAGPQRATTGAILNDINWQVQRFLLVRLITSVIVGAATAVALGLMGVRQATFWGVAAGVFNSIPYFGPVIVSGGLAVVGLIQFGSLGKAIEVAGVALVITSLEGWLLTPPLMGKAAKMNAITVFLGLLLWSWIWGVWGTILAVPMLAAVKAVCDHVPDLRPLGTLMGE